MPAKNAETSGARITATMNWNAPAATSQGKQGAFIND
jgi:hypothetical protein